MALPKSFSMETIPTPPKRQPIDTNWVRRAFPREQDYYGPLDEEDERRGTYMGMTESEFLGGDVGDK